MIFLFLSSAPRQGINYRNRRLVMMQSFFAQNRMILDKIAHRFHLLGWVLLATTCIYFILQSIIYALGAYSWSAYAMLILSVISAVFFSAVLLLIAQYLRSLVNPGHRTNWLFSHSPWVFRLYAAVLIGVFLFNVILYFLHLTKHYSRQAYFEMFITEIPHLVNLVAKVMLLYALAHLSRLLKKHLHKRRLSMNASTPQAL